MVHYKITYFGIRGRAEVARQILAYAGVPFDDVRVQGAEWGKLKSSMPFGQIPALEVDGKMLCQAQTINRYLGHKHGLGGADDWESAKIDELNDGLVDVWGAFAKAWFGAADAEAKKQVVAKFENDDFKTMLDRYDKFLAANGTGYFVGSKPSWFDIAFSEMIEGMIQEKCPNALKAHPKLVEHAQKIRSTPNLKKWIETRPKTDF